MLEERGIRVGSRTVIARERKRPLRLGGHVASYTLDNKASIAIMLELARRLDNPASNVLLVASTKEEVGAVGALYLTQHQQVDALIALEIIPLAPEYKIEDSEAPVLLAEDARGLYDDRLVNALADSASAASVPVQLAVLNGFGSDASNVLKQGHVGQAACLGFPTQNTHGFEIARLAAMENCVRILKAHCERNP
jgi:putative aminopeptidase FrvX